MVEVRWLEPALGLLKGDWERWSKKAPFPLQSRTQLLSDKSVRGWC